MMITHQRRQRQAGSTTRIMSASKSAREAGDRRWLQGADAASRGTGSGGPGPLPARLAPTMAAELVVADGRCSRAGARRTAGQRVLVRVGVRLVGHGDERPRSRTSRIEDDEAEAASASWFSGKHFTGADEHAARLARGTTRAPSVAA